MQPDTALTCMECDNRQEGKSKLIANWGCLSHEKDNRNKYIILVFMKK